MPDTNNQGESKAAETEPDVSPLPADPQPVEVPKPAADISRLSDSDGMAASDPTVDKKAERPNASRIEIAQLCVSIALAALGIIGVCIYGGQLEVMQGQLTEIQKQYPELQKSAQAAHDAEKTAEDTLKSSGESFKQEERAYLWISSESLSNPPLCLPPANNRVCADVHVVDSGRTPAIGVHIIRYATFGRHAERSIRAMKVPEYKRPDGDMLGSVGDKWGTAATDPVAPTVAADLVGGKTSLYLYGVIQDFDIFGDYHETGYCSHKLPNNGPFISCTFGNWFDRSTFQGAMAGLKDRGG